VSGISGIDRLYTIAAKLPRTVDLELHKAMQNAIKEPVADMRSAARANIAADLPSGYAPVFAGAFRIVTSVGGGTGLASIRLRGTARGRSKKRDSAALNAGVLRHKTWGRPPWHSQSVAPGFWDRAADRYAQKLTENVREAVEQAAARIKAAL
jgi:hypothetical protein